MRLDELVRLVWLNIVQNKFKVILTSIGIVVGAATIVMVIAIGQGSQAEVAEQFKNLNAGAIDISYETASTSTKKSSSSSSGTSSGGGQMPSMGGGGGQMPSGGGGQMPSGSTSGKGSSSSGSSGAGGRDFASDQGGMMGGNFGSMIIGGAGGDMSDRLNQEKIVLEEEDMDDILTFVPGLTEATISLSTKSSVEGGDLEEATSYTIGGVKHNYASMSNLTLQIGDFITESDEEAKNKVCVIGASVAKEIFGSVVDAYDSTIYIDSRPYVVNGVLSDVGSVSSGISPDTAIFIPYSTGVKYLTGTDVSPIITVIAEDVSTVETLKENIQTVLAETYSNAEFTITDAGSKMEAASSSNETLTILLIAMAVIVFTVGGIGIMNVLFVSVKERTNEIGILKAIGASKKDILLEFLLEATAISIIGGILGVLVSFGITPVVSHFNVRADLSIAGSMLAVGFALVTGTVFGFYPAWKASRLIPIEALNQD
ncbi:MAG: ABC transporter permease [bacterium]|nr:ABC transporter permease [bacterium]